MITKRLAIGATGYRAQRWPRARPMRGPGLSRRLRTTRSPGRARPPTAPTKRQPPTLSAGRSRWSGVNRRRVRPRPITVTLVATDPRIRYMIASWIEHGVGRVDPGQHQAGHRTGEEHQPDGLGGLDLGDESGSQRRPHVGPGGVGPGCPSASRASTSSRLSCSSPTIRRPATTDAVIELPIIIPASGTIVRPSTGNIPNPKITERLTTITAPIATVPRSKMPGTSRARLRIVSPAKPTMATTHSHDHASDASGSSTSLRAKPDEEQLHRGARRGPQDRPREVEPLPSRQDHGDDDQHERRRDPCDTDVGLVQLRSSSSSDDR